MLAKTKKIIKSSYWHNFRDVRFLAALAFGFIALLTAWSGVKVIGKNYLLQQEIAQLDKRNQIYKIENENLKFENQFFNTETYIELTARQQFSKGLPGEKLLIISKEEADAKAPKIPGLANEEIDKNNQPSYLQNLEAWKNFFFRRDVE